MALMIEIIETCYLCHSEIKHKWQVIAPRGALYFYCSKKCMEEHIKKGM